MANHAPPALEHVDALSVRLSGVLGEVLQQLDERLQKLEDNSSGESGSQAQLAAANARIEELEKRQGLLETASDQSHDAFESSLAGMLTKLEQVAKANRPSAAEQWDKTKKLHKPIPSPNLVQNFKEIANEAHIQARKKREQGGLLAEWTRMVEERLQALEEKVSRSMDENNVAKRAAEDAVTGMRAEVVMQALSAAESAGEKTQREVKSRMAQHDQSLDEVAKRNAALESELREVCSEARAMSIRATDDAAEASRLAFKSSKSAAEMVHLSDRVDDFAKELIRIQGAKCDVTSFEELKKRVASDASDVRMNLLALEERLLAQSVAAARDIRSELEDRMHAVQANENELKQAIRDQTRELRIKNARKLDGVHEFAALQQIASEDGRTGERLRLLQHSLGHLLQIVSRLDPGPPPAVRSADNSWPVGAGGRAANAMRGSNSLPPAGTRPALLNPRPPSPSPKRDRPASPVLAHSGHGVATSYPGQPPALGGSRARGAGLKRPASAGSIRVEITPLAKAAQAEQREELSRRLAVGAL